MIPFKRRAKCLFNHRTRLRQGCIDCVGIAPLKRKLYARIWLIIMQPIAKAEAEITELDTRLAARAANRKAGLAIGERK